MGIFGWSLPPGCGTLPGEEDEPPCEVCGQPPDTCICPECPVCSCMGDPRCYDELEQPPFTRPHGHGMEVNRYQLVARDILDRWLERELAWTELTEPLDP